MDGAGVTLPPHLRALLDPSAYPHATGAIALLHTNLSWVLLTGEYAYKIKRPVHYPFVDLREPHERQRLCHEELRLNRRFAPRLYVDVSAITCERGEARVGGGGTPVDYAVKMRQFDPADGLDALVGRGDVSEDELLAFGEQLAAAHASCPAAARNAEWGRPGAVRDALLRNLDEAAAAAQTCGTRARVDALRLPLERLIEATGSGLADRRRDGRVRECHGDLHARNVARIAGRLTPFDCLEFDPALRWIDVADELAMLRIDLAWRGRDDLAQAATNGYLRGGGDFGACRVLKLYEAHRALVRAKVAALTANADAAAGAQALDEHAALLGIAERALAPRAARLVLLCGVSGSGKSWLACRLIDALHAVWISSDVERKRLVGLGPSESSGSAPGEGIYTRAITDRTYGRLAACAEEVLWGGEVAVVDATCLREAERARFAAVARRCRVPFHVVLCEAPTEQLRERLAARGTQPGEVSEATAAVLEAQLALVEPFREQEGFELERVHTAEPGLVDRLARQFC